MTELTSENAIMCLGNWIYQEEPDAYVRFVSYLELEHMSHHSIMNAVVNGLYDGDLEIWLAAYAPVVLQNYFIIRYK